MQHVKKSAKKRGMEKTNIVKAYTEDYNRIMEVWESSVKATHDFLKQELNRYKPE